MNNSEPTDYNLILDTARQRGDTRINLKWGDTEYPFHRTPDAKGWDTGMMLPAPLWGELEVKNINGGNTNND